MTTKVNVKFKVVTPTGVPVAKAQVDITLTEPGIDYLGEGLVLPTTTKGSTNNFGLFEVALAPVNTAPYIAVVYEPKSNRKGVYEFFVPEPIIDPEDPLYDPNPTFEVSDLVLLPKPSGVSYDSASISKITSDRIRAEQAAEKAINATSPRYNVFNLSFIDVGGSQQAYLTLDQSNGFIIVDEFVGTVIIPEDNLENPAQNFDIGTAIIFVKGKTYSQINIDFQPLNIGVKLESLSPGGEKLEYGTDIISVVKTDTNTWKIFNIGGGSLGSSQGTVNDFSGSIGQNADDIAQLESWRTAFNSQLNVLTSDVNNNINSISQINSAIASLTSILTNINLTIDEKIDDAIPGLGDISAYVNSAEASATLATDSKIAAESAAGTSQLNADAAIAARDIAVAASDNATTIGGALSDMANQSSDNVNITGGEITGITALAVTDGGTGASTAENARTNLGLAIGTDVLALDGEGTDLTNLNADNIDRGKIASKHSGSLRLVFPEATVDGPGAHTIYDARFANNLGDGVYDKYMIFDMSTHRDSIFEGNTPSAVMFRISFMLGRITDHRYTYIVRRKIGDPFPDSGNWNLIQSNNNFIWGTGSDDTDQGNRQYGFFQGLVVQPYEEIYYWYAQNRCYGIMDYRKLKIDIVGYQV